MSVSLLLSLKCKKIYQHLSCHNQTKRRHGRQEPVNQDPFTLRRHRPKQNKMVCSSFSQIDKFDNNDNIDMRGFTTNLTSACKTETLGSLYSHALLILLKSSKSKHQVVHEQKFKDFLSSTCQVRVERIVLDLESEAAWVLFPLGVTFCHWIFFHVVKPLMSILSLLPILSICEKLGCGEGPNSTKMYYNILYSNGVELIGIFMTPSLVLFRHPPSPS